MAAKTLTDTSIKRMSKPGEYGDAGTIGLYLRITTAGRKVWRYRYQLRGKTQIMTLGEFDEVSLADARADATKYRADVLAGNNPAAAAQRDQAERRAMPTVEEFISEYVERYAKRNKKSWKQDQQMLERWLVPAIDKLRMDEVTRRDIAKVLDDCHDTGATRQPGKILAVTRMMFKFAVQRGVLDTTPCTFIVETQPEAEKKAMTEDEIRHWWAATALEPPIMQKSMALALRLLLLTGQRPSEVAGITHNELHLDSPLGPHWICPGERRKRGRAKKGKTHAIALEPEAVAVIQEAMEYADDQYLFPRQSGGTHTTSALCEVVREVMYKDWDDKPKPHAARHTVATELEELGIEEYHIGRVLGHASKTVTGLYIKKRVNESALNIQRKHLAAWEARLAEIVSGEKGATNVVNLGAMRA